MAEEIDTLVLGCTHYPLLKKTLRQVLGDRVALVDSAEETSRTVEAMLNGRKLPRRSPPSRPRFFVTDIPTRFVLV